MTLLASFAALLHRYTGQDDLIVGTVVANRTRSEVEPLIGVFVNTLALRGRLQGDPPFRELLARTRAAVLEAFAHHELPFDRLVEELRPQRSLARGPLFDVMAVRQDGTRSVESLAGLDVRAMPVDLGAAQFDLGLSVTETAEGLQASMEYAADLFDAATIDRLLEDVTVRPDARLSELAVLTAAERHRVLVEWHDTRASFPADQGVHELFMQRAARTPGALAVSDGSRRFTYRELGGLAGRLSGRLRALGAGPGATVGVAFERSADMVIGMLGVLLTGAAYVPLDPSSLRPRLEFVLRQTGCVALVSSPAHARSLPGGGVPVVLLDDSGGDLPPRGTPGGGDRLAYVMFTSGSTGEPKGVAVPHRAVTRLVLGTDYVSPGPGMSSGTRRTSRSTPPRSRSGVRC
jgi:aspartate racemase